jgi:hypothetical protein
MIYSSRPPQYFTLFWLRLFGAREIVKFHDPLKCAFEFRGELKVYA